MSVSLHHLYEFCAITVYCTNTITNPGSLFHIVIYDVDCISRESVQLLTRLAASVV
jgi:hypothetical protein